MVFKRESGYQLHFINDDQFEIFCLDCNDTKFLKMDLEQKDFVQNIALEDVVHEKFLDKITGLSSNKVDLTTYLKNWFDRQAKHKVKTYQHFD